VSRQRIPNSFEINELIDDPQIRQVMKPGSILSLTVCSSLTKYTVEPGERMYVPGHLQTPNESPDPLHSANPPKAAKTRVILRFQAGKVMTNTTPSALSSGHPSDIEFSVCITCFNEEKSIDEFYRRLSAALESLHRSYEIIFVNDGSRDATWEKLKGIFARDPQVHAVLDMFKNAGQQAAATAAVEEMRGRALVLMDSDLQLAPEDLPRLVAEYDRGFDMVTGYRQHRQDSLFRIVPSKLANVIMRRVSRSNLRDFGCTYKIFNGALVRAFETGPHKLLNGVEMIAKIERIAEVPVSHFPRRYGKSGWTFSRLMKYNMDNVVVLSERPFQVVGFLCIVVTCLLIARIGLNLLFPVAILSSVTNGLLLNAIVIALLINVALLSLIGEFAIRSFFRQKQIPLYIVRERLLR
jgi:undecaprenyl-phosphate 4-deoxy-4-formamido-L-arabinose transferase